VDWKKDTSEFFKYGAVVKNGANGPVVAPGSILNHCLANESFLMSKNVSEERELEKEFGDPQRLTLFDFQVSSESKLMLQTLNEKKKSGHIGGSS